jgi:hypothetical protein
MKFKNLLLFIFSLFVCGSAFSQDPAKTKQILYKIPADKVKPIGCSPESKILPRIILPVSSSDSVIRKEAIVVQPSDAAVSKDEIGTKKEKK